MWLPLKLQGTSIEKPTKTRTGQLDQAHLTEKILAHIAVTNPSQVRLTKVQVLQPRAI